MRVMITGATGFLGRHLTAALLARGDEVVALSRSPRHGDLRGVVWRTWDAEHVGDWANELETCDAAVHLAGEPVGDGRWTPARKARIRHSRMTATRTMAEALAAASPRPRTLVSASGVGIYGPRDSQPIDETAPLGTDFLAAVCRDWEAATEPAQLARVRVVQLRIGVVLAADGGALPKMLPAFRLGLGGVLGSGTQGLPWIHRDDAIAFMLWALDHESWAGPVNATAPTPVSNAAFTRTLNHVLRRPGFLPVPGVALRALFGEMADVLLTGAYVLPRVAEQSGFRFRFPTLEPALRSLLDPGGPR